MIFCQILLISKKGKQMKFSRLIATSFVVASTLFGGNYMVDTSHSSTDFSVKHLMISNVKGNFTTFNGSFEYDEKSKQLIAHHI